MANLIVWFHNTTFLPKALDESRSLRYNHCSEGFAMAHKRISLVSFAAFALFSFLGPVAAQQSTTTTTPPADTAKPADPAKPADATKPADPAKPADNNTQQGQ